MNKAQTKPKYKSGQQVLYTGYYLQESGKVYSIEGNAQIKSDGYYYDLNHPGLKVIHESELSPA